MELLQLLDFDLLLPQKAGVTIVLHGEILLVVGGGWQWIGDVLCILEGRAIEKVRISIRLLGFLGEEGSDEVPPAELVCLHGWGEKERKGGRLGGGRKRGPGREVGWTCPKNWVGNVK